MPELTPFEQDVKNMRKYQKEVFESGNIDSRNMARVFEGRVDEYFEEQQSLFKT